MDKITSTPTADRWNPVLYDEKHQFVSEYGRSLISLLEPKPGERILDLGCGTGQLTKSIAETGAQVVGMDNSPAMIAAARERYPEMEFVEGDATSFSFPYLFDGVFSNAALHWVFAAEAAVKRIAAALKSGGRFVAEFGGQGNVGAIVAALRAALREHGVNDERPWWYYPTVGEYATLLEKLGLGVEFATLRDRPTKLEDGAHGLRNWIEMFKGEIFTGLNAEVKERILRDVENKLRMKLFREGDWYADYRRLRIRAIKT